MQFIKSSHPAQKIMQILNKFQLLKSKLLLLKKKKSKKLYFHVSIYWSSSKTYKTRKFTYQNSSAAIKHEKSTIKLSSCHFHLPPLINNFYLYRQLAQVTTKATRVVNSDTGWSYQMTTGIRQQCKYYHKHSAVNGRSTSHSCKDLFCTTCRCKDER